MPKQEPTPADPFDSIPAGLSSDDKVDPEDLFPETDSFMVDVPEDALDGSFYIAPGIYRAQLVDLQKEISSKGNQTWRWTFSILEDSVHGGKYVGKTLSQWTAITPAAMWKLAETLNALGLGKPGERATFRKDDAIGRIAAIDVVDTDYGGKKRSSLQTVTPLRGPNGEIGEKAPLASSGQPF